MKESVLVNIHGGGFLTGSNRDGSLQPEQFIHEHGLPVVQVRVLETIKVRTNLMIKNSLHSKLQTGASRLLVLG